MARWCEGKATGVQADAVAGQLPGGHALEAAMAAQHREVAALQAQMAMLGRDMTALRQGSSMGHVPQLPFKQVPAVSPSQATFASCAYLAREAFGFPTQLCSSRAPCSCVLLTVYQHKVANCICLELRWIDVA